MNKWLKLLVIILAIILGLIGFGSIYFKQYERRQAKESQFRSAVQNKDFITIEESLKQGVNIDAQNPKSGQNALSWAIDSGNLEMVNYLISHGAKSTWAGTALDYAVFAFPSHPNSKNRKIIHYLVDLKIPNKKESPLLTALIVGNIDEVKKWLSNEEIKKLTTDEFRHLVLAAKYSSDAQMLRFLKQEIAPFPDLDDEKRKILTSSMMSVTRD